MRAIRVQQRGIVCLEEVPKPAPGPGEALVRTACCAICATDLEMIAGWDRTPYPTTPGHEWSGVVEAVGAGVARDTIGRPCVGENVIPCGACGPCRRSRPEVCRHSREVGFELPGGYGEYFVTRAANLRFLKRGTPLTTATLAEPTAVILHGLARLHGKLPAAGPTLIMGDGPIGLLLALALRDQGAEDLTLVGGRQRKLDLAAEFGATGTWSYKMPQAELIANLKASAPEGYSLCAEASGSPNAFALLTALTAKDGEILGLGDYGARCADLPLTVAVQQELRFVFSNSGAGAWDASVAFLARRHEDMGRMITHLFRPEEFDAALETVQHKRDECIKAVFRWETED